MDTHDFGTDPHKLVRRKDPVTSHEAANAVNSNRWESRVYRAILSFGVGGAIQDEILRWVEVTYGRVPYSTVTARFKALEEKGLIKYTDKTRKGNSGRHSRIRVASRFIGQQDLF